MCTNGLCPGCPCTTPCCICVLVSVYLFCVLCLLFAECCILCCTFVRVGCLARNWKLPTPAELWGSGGLLSYHNCMVQCCPFYAHCASNAGKRGVFCVDGDRRHRTTNLGLGTNCAWIRYSTFMRVDQCRSCFVAQHAADLSGLPLILIGCSRIALLPHGTRTGVQTALRWAGHLSHSGHSSHSLQDMHCLRALHARQHQHGSSSVIAVDPLSSAGQAVHVGLGLLSETRRTARILAIPLIYLSVIYSYSGTGS